MTLEDPYFVVKDEVSKALTKTRDLFTRLDELKQVVSRCGNLSVPATPTLVNTGLPMIINAQEELEWTNTEIKNALRSIDWDLEDLEDTICIVEKNPSKFKTDHKELAVRRMFIDHTREELKIMKDRMNINRDRDRDPSVRQSTTNDNDTASRVTPIKAPPQGHNHAQAKYSKLQTAEPGEDDMSSPHRMCLQDAMCNPNYRLPGMTLAAPKKLTHSQSDNTGILKTVSRQIGSQDLDERQVMLDDLGNEMEIITDSKYDTTMSKMARVFQLSNGNYKNKYAPAPTQANMTPPHHRRNFGGKQQQLDNDYNRQIPNPCSIASTITNCFYICNRN